VSLAWPCIIIYVRCSAIGRVAARRRRQYHQQLLDNTLAVPTRYNGGKWSRGEQLLSRSSLPPIYTLKQLIEVYVPIPAAVVLSSWLIINRSCNSIIIFFVGNVAYFQQTFTFLKKKIYSSYNVCVLLFNVRCCRHVLGEDETPLHRSAV
jgi:hypothetical protein